jgi:glycerol-3-phosphate dehydrogenase
MTSKNFDLVVVGGGINGAGIATDAAGRGLNVFLCEQNDFASATSSASSKLIHGGLRYLEHYEFRLVKEALKEREILLKNAPHLVKPMRFILPHRPHLRPAWMIRTGLFMYDQLGKREALKKTKKVKFNGNSPLNKDIKQGFEYADCWVDDARLVITNLLQAKNKGASIHNQTRCIAAKQVNDLWHCQMENIETTERYEVTAKALVNAAGPWVAKFIKESTASKSPYGIRLIKGSHIVVPRIHQGKEAFILQNKDKRIVFVIPYLEDFSIVGTTDVEFKGNPSDVKISQQEIDYLLTVANDHFKEKLNEQDIVWSYSGVRPLCDDESDSPSAITRDYTLAMCESKNAPLLSIFGGKITTYRKLAEAAMEKLSSHFLEMGKPWTQKEALPGGDFPEGKAKFIEMLQTRFSWLDKKLVERYADAYGTICLIFLKNINSQSDMGEDFGHGLYKCEVDYLVEHEWVRTAADLLWRRSKLGLFLSMKQQSHLNQYLKTVIN